MRAGAAEHDAAWLGGIVKRVNEQEIAANMAFAMACPIPGQRVIQPLGGKGPSLATSNNIASFSHAYRICRRKCAYLLLAFSMSSIKSSAFAKRARRSFRILAASAIAILLVAFGALIVNGSA